MGRIKELTSVGLGDWHWVGQQWQHQQNGQQLQNTHHAPGFLKKTFNPSHSPGRLLTGRAGFSLRQPSS